MHETEDMQKVAYPWNVLFSREIIIIYVVNHKNLVSKILGYTLLLIGNVQ